MKKLLALGLAVVMMFVLFCVPAFALAAPSEMVQVLMSSDNVTISEFAPEEKAAMDDLAEALNSAEPGVIPLTCKVAADRITVMRQMNLTSEDGDVFDVSFKAWSTVGRTICLFFRAEESETWELMACNKGDVIEARFPCSGSCVVAVAW